MIIEEIRKNKPEGATHYNPNAKSAIYYKIVNGAYKVYHKKHNMWYGSGYYLGDNNIKPL